MMCEIDYKQKYKETQQNHYYERKCWLHNCLLNQFNIFPGFSLLSYIHLKAIKCVITYFALKCKHLLVIKYGGIVLKVCHDHNNMGILRPDVC